jgi:hypothetical protein
MCQWGTDTIVRVKIAPHLSHTGEAYWKEVGVDSCIADLVRALQEGGIDMLASCCGHGQRDGEIILADGRQLIIRRRVCHTRTTPPRSRQHSGMSR